MEEAKSTTVYFFDKCRLCLNNAGVKNIVNEYIQEDVYLCTGVRVTDTDDLPQKLCEMCYDIVTKAKHLRLLATKNDNFLKLLFDCDSDVETLIIDTKSEPESDKEETQLMSSQDRESSVPGLSICVRSDLFNKPQSLAPKRQLDAAKEGLQERKVYLENGQTEFECLICNRRYPTHKKLYHHQRQHNKTMHCPLEGCPRTFASKADLQKHQRTHTGERPYGCNICQKTFTQKITLRQHTEKIHNILGP